MPNIGGWEIVIVVVLALIIFGPKKLPELGSSLGRSITGFKKGLRDAKEELQETEEPPATAEPSAPDGAQAQAEKQAQVETRTPVATVAQASPHTSSRDAIEPATAADPAADQAQES